jgi:hypothetical protein
MHFDLLEVAQRCELAFWFRDLAFSLVGVQVFTPFQLLC